MRPSAAHARPPLRLASIAVLACGERSHLSENLPSTSMYHPTKFHIHPCSSLGGVRPHTHRHTDRRLTFSFIDIDRSTTDFSFWHLIFICNVINIQYFTITYISIHYEQKPGVSASAALLSARGLDLGPGVSASDALLSISSDRVDASNNEVSSRSFMSFSSSFIFFLAACSSLNCSDTFLLSECMFSTVVAASLESVLICFRDSEVSTLFYYSFSC